MTTSVQTLHHRVGREVGVTRVRSPIRSRTRSRTPISLFETTGTAAASSLARLTRSRLCKMKTLLSPPDPGGTFKVALDVACS